MGRANVYLPDDLERRVKAAQIPISEVCQRALLVAVESAEGARQPFSAAVREQFGRGRQAGADWAAGASPVHLLALLRDQRLEEIPAEALPHDLYSLTQEESLGWEAGFVEATLASARAATPAKRQAPQADIDAESGASEAGAQTDPESRTASERPALGDDSGCRIGVSLDGDPVSFDPHAAVRAGKSPLFAILGDADQRSRLSLSLAQDAAARGTGVILVDLSGQLSARAKGLGKNVRLIRNQVALPQLDDLVKGAIGLGGLLGTLSNLSSSTGLSQMFNRSNENLVEPGYVTILNLSGDGGIATAISVAQGLSRLTGPADFPRLLQVDLPSGINVPSGLAARVGRIVRTAREQNAAIGLSAESAQAVREIAGGGSLLSTVFAFATSSPAEADRIRDLLGAGAPVLLNAPGTSSALDDEPWAVLRDLNGRLGQVRIAGA